MLDVKNISLKVKIYMMVAIFVAASVLSLGYTLLSMTSIGSELVSIAERDIPLTRKVTKITTHQLEQAVIFERSIRYGEEMQSEDSVQKKFNGSRDEFNAFNQKINEDITAIESFATQGIAAALSDMERKEFSNVREVITVVSQQRKEYVAHAEQAFTHLQNKKVTDALVSVEQAELAEKDMTSKLNKMLTQIEAFTAQAALSAEHHEQAAVKVIIIIAVVSAIVAGVIFIVVLSGVSRLVWGMKRSFTITNNIAKGDLTEVIEVTGQDEIGKLLTSLKAMRDSIHDMVMQMSQSANELARSSEELAAVSEDSSQGIHTQQSEIQQAATAMNEMTSTVQEVARNAQETSESTSKADQESKHSQTVIEKTVASIEALEKVVNKAATVIEQVGKESNNIGSVLDVIKGIAEQTNLLALNAAIEAARAGEQGRGFAVVADEVRTLAQRTQDSTSEIDEMITGLQESTKNAISAMSTGREQATQSVGQAAEAGVSIQAIAKVIGHINDMNLQIASAAEEQSAVAEEVNRNVITINEVAEQNATAVNQITASSEELSKMAVGLQEMIARFKV